MTALPTTPSAEAREGLIDRLEALDNGTASEAPWVATGLAAEAAKALRATQGGAEPVAWQERIYGIDAKPGRWTECRAPEDPTNLRPSRMIEYRPLFAHPAPEQAGEAERLRGEVEALTKVEPWWQAVIGDEYTPSGKLGVGVKHLHPLTVKPIFEAHKGTEVADVIAGLIFNMMIANNRGEFLAKYANERAEAAEQALADMKAERALDRAAMQAGVDGLMALCNGHPAAEIAWPHRPLHELADTFRARLSNPGAKDV